MEDPEEPHLERLAAAFARALTLREQGKTDTATEALAAILLEEPRLAEPRMELARIYLDAERLEDAESEIREAIRLLSAGGQWVEDIPEGVLQAMAWAILGEILKERASSDEVVFGDPAIFRDLIDASQKAFAKAHELDPTDTAAEVNALELQQEPDDDELPEA